MARKIEVQIVGDASSLQRAVNQSSGALGGLGSGLARLGRTAAFAAGAAGVAGIAITLRQGIREYTESAKVGAQTNAVIKSTGGIANVTARQVEELSTAMMRKTGIDDEAIAAGQNMLLTFTKVRNEVGKGNDIFNQATVAVSNVATALGKEMPDAALLVGKALNDPVRGMTALTRAGIQFTESQKESIKSMVESGNVMGAQKLILEELTTQFGGSAEAIGKTLPGQLAILKESFNNFAGGLIANVAPALLSFTGFLNEVIAAEGIRAKLNIVWEGVQEAAAKLAARLSEAISGVDWAAVGSTVNAKLGEILTSLGGGEGGGDFGGIASKIVSRLSDALNKADWSQIGRTAGERLREQISQGVSNAESQGFAPSWAKFTASMRRAVENSFATLSPLMRISPGTFVDSLGRLMAAATGFFGGLLGITQSSMQRFVLTVGQGVQRGVAAVRGAIGDFVGAARAIGSGIASGIVAGTAGLAGRLAASLTSQVSSAISAVKGFILSRSPSELFAKQIGEPIGEGITIGAVRAAAKLGDDLRAIVFPIIDRLSEEVGERVANIVEDAYDKIRRPGEPAPPDLVGTFGPGGLVGTPTPLPGGVGQLPVTAPPAVAGPPAKLGASTVTFINYAPITSEQQLEDMVRESLGRVTGRQGFS